jgi:hypothetical protein
MVLSSFVSAGHKREYLATRGFRYVEKIFQTGAGRFLYAFGNKGLIYTGPSFYPQLAMLGG